VVEIRPGCEPWSCEGSGINGDIGILAIHGFTGSPASMRPLGEDLAERGFAVELPLLPGHGHHDWKHLLKVTWQDMAKETVAAFERLRSRTTHQFIVGLSNGGLIAMRLAQTRADDLSGIVVINPFLATKDPRTKILPLLKMVVPSFPGVVNDIAKPGQDELGYERLPLRALASTMEMQRHVRAGLPSLTVPTLLFTSRQDHVIGTYSSEVIEQQIGSPDFEHVWLERSYHVATLDYDYPEILEGTAAFAQRVAGVTA
jgi:carboxylesterase